MFIVWDKVIVRLLVYEIYVKDDEDVVFVIICVDYWFLGCSFFSWLVLVR